MGPAQLIVQILIAMDTAALTRWTDFLQLLLVDVIAPTSVTYYPGYLSHTYQDRKVQYEAWGRCKRRGLCVGQKRHIASRLAEV